MKILRNEIVYYNNETTSTRAGSFTDPARFLSIATDKSQERCQLLRRRRHAMGKILLAILGVAAVIVEQVLDDE